MEANQKPYQIDPHILENTMMYSVYRFHCFRNGQVELEAEPGKK
jgi:hypothetical protein